MEQVAAFLHGGIWKGIIMGAAKQRGTLEERMAAAKSRNAKLQWAIEHGQDQPLQKSLKRVGIRRVVAAL